MDKEDARALEKHYWSQAKRGVIPTVEDLSLWARQSGRGFDERRARGLRHRWKAIARHSRWRRPPAYMSASIDKLGNVMIDMAHFSPQLRVFNKQCRYFLVGVDCFSQRLACVPLATKTRASWERGVVEMKERHFPVMTTIVTDRDTAVAGEVFQRAFRERYGIRWIHLRSRQKAYKAERMIRYLKERLSMALQASEEAGDPERLNWIRHVPGIVDDYNSRFISGTSIRRRDAGHANYFKILEQKYGFSNPTVRFNSSVSGNFSSRSAALLFKYPPGTRVLLAREADYTADAGAGPQGAFAKRSVTGAYGKIYRVSHHLLKSSGKFFLTPVYGLEGLQGLFYESELTPALFSEKDVARHLRHRKEARIARAEEVAAEHRRRPPTRRLSDRDDDDDDDDKVSDNDSRDQTAADPTHHHLHSPAAVTAAAAAAGGGSVARRIETRSRTGAATRARKS
jgi:hypothetical protein